MKRIDPKKIKLRPKSDEHKECGDVEVDTGTKDKTKEVKFVNEFKLNSTEEAKLIELEKKLTVSRYPFYRC